MRSALDDDGPVGVALFGPPYRSFHPIQTPWYPDHVPPRGLAIIWWLHDGIGQTHEFEWLYQRSRGLPLFVVLPPPSELDRTLPLLRYVNGLSPRAVLPGTEVASAQNVQLLLSTPPRNLPTALARYLSGRGLLPQSPVRREIEHVLHSAPAASNVSALARRLFTSRRTLGRHFAAAGLPVPSHWLQFARLMHAATMLQKNQRMPMSRISSHLGYPDPFTMSNQMKRLLGLRPSDARLLLGWEWIVESWICQEVKGGSFDCVRYYDAARPYLNDR